jgi:D-tyrosyl-tRNA(Tyr) deacylase
MKALLQRVSRASVTVNAKCVGAIEQGLLVLLGLDRADDRVVADCMVDKLLGYRLFADGQGRMNRSVVDVRGGVLLVSQFTLSADTSQGLRPGFSSAMPPTEAAQLYDYLLSRLQQRHPQVASGVFGADMQVSLVNEGPVTFLLEV